MNLTRFRFTVVATLIAGALLPTLASAAADDDIVMTTNSDKWQFSVLAYGFLPQISGRAYFPVANAGGSVTLSQSDLLNNLNLTAMGSFDAHYQRWGFFTDFLYMDLGKSKDGQRDFDFPNFPPGSLYGRINFDLKAWIVTSALEYRVVVQPDFVMDTLVGARYFYLKQSVNWFIENQGTNLPPDVIQNGREKSGDVVDAIVGFKGQWMFGPGHSWSLPYYADVGGGDSKLTWQVAAGIAYRYHAWTFGAMYREINYHIQTSGLQDINIKGPMAGAQYRW